MEFVAGDHERLSGEVGRKTHEPRTSRAALPALKRPLLALTFTKRRTDSEGVERSEGIGSERNP